MERTRMERIARGLGIALKVIWILLIVVAAVMGAALVLVMVVLFAWPEAFYSLGMSALNVGPFHIQLEGVAYPFDQASFSPGEQEAIALGIVATALFAAAVIVCGFIAVALLRRIVAPMEEGRPFSAANADDVRRLAFVALAYWIAETVASSVIPLIFMGAFGSTFSLGLHELSVEPSFQMDLSWLFVFFVLLLLSYVFRYGADLQKLSDETV